MNFNNMNIDIIDDFILDIALLIEEVPFLKDDKAVDDALMKCAKLYDDFAEVCGFDMLESSLKYGEEDYPDTWLNKGWVLCKEELTENIDYLPEMIDDYEEDEWWVTYVTGLYYDTVELINRYAGCSKPKKKDDEKTTSEKKLLDEYKNNHKEDIVINDKEYDVYKMVCDLAEALGIDVNEIENKAEEKENFLDRKRKDLKDANAKQILEAVYSMYHRAEKLSDLLFKFNFTYDDAIEIIEGMIDDLTDYVIVAREKRDKLF